ncbi:MAG TPA: hypothetical protein VKR41_01430 [Puia sp.]|nr:hypothetical protein [Puia sp.]
MTDVPYSYKRVAPRRYIFTSVGRFEIKKVVEFVPLKVRNVVNLGFGDLLPDGSFDDKANSNNGDILKVLATVVHILKYYISQNPEIAVFFTGSTKDRTRLYTRIIRTYYSLFAKEFVLYGIIETDRTTETILFNAEADLEYLAFLIKRIN